MWTANQGFTLKQRFPYIDEKISMDSFKMNNIEAFAKKKKKEAGCEAAQWDKFSTQLSRRSEYYL
jgi:hypothetical protein